MEQKYYDEFSKLMLSSTEKDPMIRLSNVIADMTLFRLQDVDIEYRLNFIVDNIPQDKSSIDWDTINKILSTNVKDTDFNLFETPLNSVDELHELRNEILSTYLFGGKSKWRKIVCKDCGEVFYLTKKEISYFKSRDLHIPKRCESCRAKRRLK